MAGVTPQGYELKTLAEINSDAQTDLANIKDPVTGDSYQADLSDPTDIVSQTVAITLEGVADGFLVDQAAYNQFDPSKATDDALSSLVLLNGIERKDATPSTVLLSFIGTPDVTIPASAAIQVTNTSNTSTWLVTDDIEINSLGVAVGVPAQSIVDGIIKAPASSLTVIVTPNSDLQQVTNPNAATPGEDVETDAALRQRRQQSTLVPSIGLAAGTNAAIQDLDGVVFSVLYTNNTMTFDSNGVPPKTEAAVVVGGEEEAIAQVLFSRNGSADYAGNVSVQFQDNQGFINTVKFYRPEEIPIFIQINLTLVGPDIFPPNGVEQIINNIIAYSQSGAFALGITDGFDTDGFPPGSPILVSRLYTPVNAVPGHSIDSLLIGYNDTDVFAEDLTLAFNQVGQFLEENITVNV